jgi:uncharacterized protein (TIGR02271 family)
MVDGDDGLGHRADRSQSSSGGFFSRLFGVDHESSSNYYANRPAFERDESYFSDLNTGGKSLMVCENTSMSDEQIKDIIHRNGGEVESHAGERFDRARDQIRKLTLYEEQLTPDKRRVETGEVHVHKEIVTEHKTIEVPVEREEVVIERHPISTSSDSPLTAEHRISANMLGKDDEIRIPVSEEQVSVEKRTVPKEEVTISKEKISETRTLSDEVAHEEARVESKGSADVRDRRKSTTGSSNSPSRSGQREDRPQL